MRGARPIPILGGSYDDTTMSWSTQDTVNWIPEVAQVEGTRTPTKFRSAPGLKPFVNIGVTGAIRGAHNVEEKLFVVSGSMLYRISNTGVAIPIGTIPGTGRVSMAHNQITGGNQLIVVNGSAGYVYNTVTSVFERITDPGYPGASVVDFVDGYLVQVEPAGRFALISDLADALSYNELDRFESEGSPDRIVTLAVNQREVVMFNRTTTEFFQNTGQATGTFQSKGIVTDYGCAGRHTVVKMDNSLILLDHTGRLVRLDDYTFSPVSTVPFEQTIASEDWANAFAFAYESEGHKIYYITFPSGKTYGFDVTTRLFHRRESYGLDRWRVNTLTYWNRKWIAGDFQGPKLYELDWNYMLEGEGDPLVSERITGVAHGNQNRVEIPYFEPIFDTGQPETVPVLFPEQPDGPTISGEAPDGALGIPYDEFTYTTIEGDAAIVSVKLVSGSVPTGLTTTEDGEIEAGTPTAIDTFTGTWRVTDANGLWAEHTDTIAINAVSFAVPVTNAGIVRVSETGEDWTNSVDSGLGENVVLLSACGGNVYAIGDGVGRVSTDAGETWGDMVGILGAQPPLAMAFSEGVWILVYNSTDDFSRSTDGINFSTVSTSVPRSWGGVAGIGDTFVVPGTLGNGAISQDAGLTWVDSGIHPSGSIDMDEIIATSNGFVIADVLGDFLTSATGLTGTWTAHEGPFGAFGATAFCESGGRLIVINTDDSYYSVDNCETWATAGLLSSGVTLADRNIVHNGIRFIVGLGLGIDLSDDGEEWTPAVVGTGSEFRVASLGNNS